MTNDLATLLQDRLADERPDLDRLVRVATTQGMRRRRARVAGVVVGTAAAVTAIGGIGFAVGGGPGTSAGDESKDLAAGGNESVAPALHLGQQLRAPSGALVTVTKAAHYPGTRSSAEFLLTVLHARRGDVAALKAAYPDQLVVAARRHAGEALGGQLADKPPVAVGLQGWSCEWYVADDKGWCTTAGGDGVSVIWRPASEHDEYTTDPDKTGVGGIDYWVSEVHDGLFVTVQPGAHTTQATIDAVGASITWVD